METIAERFSRLERRLREAEKLASDTMEYAERTCRIYHGLYQAHADRLAALERRAGEA